MGIFSRLNRVVKSNLDALVDRAEDPEKLIAQTIDDMRDEVKRAKRELLTTLGHAKRLLKKQQEAAEEIDGWERKATLALQEGDEALARDALRFKLKAEREARELREQAAQQESAAEEMKATLEEVEAKIEELESRKASLASQVRRARSAGTGDLGEGPAGGGAFGELGRMVGRIEQLEAEVEASDVLDDAKRAAVDARFRELERGERGGAVEDELAALKRKLQG
jgi:phage shock protein A